MRVAPVLGAVAAVGAAAAVWGIGVERYLFAVRTASAAVFPPESTAIRVLHVSDLHMAPWQHRKQDWIASLAGLKPDLIVNTGDNLGHENGLAGVQRAFESFAGIPGVFVHGSNDVDAPTPRNPLRYFAGPSRKPRNPEALNTAALDGFFTATLGWINLNNTAASMQVADHALTFMGVSDAHRNWDDLDALPSVLPEVAKPGATRIGVTHAPYRRVLNTFVHLGAEVIFAGHTHGGQVRVPGLGALVSNTDIPLGYARGLSSWRYGARDVPLNVSAGVGTSIYAPVRFATRPEVTLLTLTARR